MTVTGNDASYNGVIGIEAEGRLNTDYTHFRNSGIAITGNSVHDNSGSLYNADGEGILVDWSDNVLVANNTVFDNAIWVGAILSLGSTSVSITGNLVENNITAAGADPDGYGIAAWAHYDVYGAAGINQAVTISNNILRANSNGIFFRDVQDSYITGNTIERTDNTSNGIIVDSGTASRNVGISNNTITLSGSGTAIGVNHGWDWSVDS